MIIVGIIVEVQYHVINKKKSLPFLSIIMGIIIDVLDHVIIKKKKFCIFP
jgi:hypothetical protein